MPPAAAILGGAVVSGVAGNKAAKKQASATRDAAAMADPFRGERGHYQGILRNIYSTSSEGGLEGGGIGDFIRSNPAYEFTREEALRGVNRQAAGKGLFRSGNAMAALQDRAAGLASTTYESEINRIMTMAGATSGSPAVAGQLGARAGGIEAAGTQNMLGQIGYGIQRGISAFNQPTTAGGMIQGQTGYTGGAEGVLSGDEWASWG